MSSFNPNDLLKNIPDEVRAAHQDQSSTDFIAECKAGGEDGMINLTASAIATLALNLHMELSRLVTGRAEGGEQFKAMWDALSPQAQMTVMLSAPVALGAGIGRRHIEVSAEGGGPIAMLRAVDQARSATKTGLLMGDDVAAGLKAAKEADNAPPGPISQKINGATLHMRPFNDKPKDTPRA